MPFAGKTVLSLESRRASETAELIRRQEGVPLVAPSMREVPIEANQAAFDFAERLFRGDFDSVILLTGVGTRFLKTLVESRYAGERFAEALRTIVTIARGPKPSGVLREMGIVPTEVAPEPNTWREVLKIAERRPERRIAVQEYGVPARELTDGLLALGAEVTSVPVYQWELPEDLGPLREAARALADRKVDISLFTTSTQLIHLFDLAAREGLQDEVGQGLRSTVICSIGPTTSETLREHGFEPDLEPSHPKLGLLVKEAAEQWVSLAARKSGAAV